LQQNRLEELHQYFDDARQQNRSQAKAFYLQESDLLNQFDYHQAAHLLLSVALEQYQQDIELLYSRATTSNMLHDLSAMEADFKAILQLDPDNAMTLNAYGYTLVDQTRRYEEGLQYIVKANDLKPEDPAIIDSLGWAMLKLGKTDQAVALLRKAYGLYPDPEIAAHFIEALIANGESEQATDLMRESLASHPDDADLLETLDRLGIDLTP